MRPDPTREAISVLGPSRVGFAARASRGFALDCPVGGDGLEGGDQARKSAGAGEGLSR